MAGLEVALAKERVEKADMMLGSQMVGVFLSQRT
jgi:hypothetical protein